MKKILLLASFLIAGTTQMNAQKTAVAKDGWNTVGITTVNFQSETEEILIPDSDKLKAIKLFVSEAPIYLDSFDIHFANGEKQTVNYGGYDPILLNGKGERSVTKITIRYKRIDSFDKRARVEVIGLKTNAEKSNSNIASR